MFVLHCLSNYFDSLWWMGPKWLGIGAQACSTDRQWSKSPLAQHSTTTCWQYLPVSDAPLRGYNWENIPGNDGWWVHLCVQNLPLSLCLLACSGGCKWSHSLGSDLDVCLLHSLMPRCFMSPSAFQKNEKVHWELLVLSLPVRPLYPQWTMFLSRRALACV